MMPLFDSIVIPYNYSVGENITITLAPAANITGFTVEYSFDRGTTWHVAAKNGVDYLIPTEPADQLDIRMSGMDVNGNSIRYVSPAVSLLEQVKLDAPKFMLANPDGTVTIPCSLTTMEDQSLKGFAVNMSGENTDNYTSPDELGNFSFDHKIDNSPCQLDITSATAGVYEGATAHVVIYEPCSGEVNTSTGTGIATFSTSLGDIVNLKALGEATVPLDGKPEGITFPDGLFSFDIINITAGSAVTVTITLPSAVAADTDYWKYNIGKGWYQVPITSFIDNVVTIQLIDGGENDADGLADTRIVDPGGPAVAAPSAQVVPAISAPRASPPTAMPRLLNPAQISVKYLSASPKKAASNQPVAITTSVVNSGDQSGNYYVVLKVNGHVEQAKLVNVGPQATQSVRFNITKAKPGSYSIDIGGQKTGFTVTDDRNESAYHNFLAGLIIGILSLAVLMVLLLLLRRFVL